MQTLNPSATAEKQPKKPAPTKAPTAVTVTRFRDSVGFDKRSGGPFMTILAAQGPNKWTENGGFVMTTTPEGVLVLDPINQTKTLVPWSNVQSVQMAWEE